MNTTPCLQYCEDRCKNLLLLHSLSTFLRINRMKGELRYHNEKKRNIFYFKDIAFFKFFVSRIYSTITYFFFTFYVLINTFHNLIFAILIAAVSFCCSKKKKKNWRNFYFRLINHLHVPFPL